MPNDSVKEFLDRIAKIESSDDYMAQHRTMKTGIHKGMTAVGRYGLMPFTIAEMVQKKVKADAHRPEQPVIEVEETFVGPTPEPDAPAFEPGEAEVSQLGRFLDPRFGAKTPEYRQGAMQMGRAMSDSPEGQDYIARQMAMELLQKTGGDQDRAAYMWTMGHNMPIDRASAAKLDSSDYVQKFRKLAAKDSDVPQLEEESRTKKRFKVLPKNLAKH